MEDKEKIFQTALRLAISSKYRKLLWYGFVPAFFTTIIGTFTYSLRGYQYWVELFEGRDFKGDLFAFLQSFFGFFSQNTALVFAFFFLGIVFLFSYLLVPIIFNGGFISILPKVIENEPMKLRAGIIEGTHFFFKLFEYKAALSPFRFFWVFMIFWIAKTFSPESLAFLGVPLFLWFLIDVFANFFLIFSEYFIVLKKQPVFSSMKQSVKLVFLNMEEVSRIVFLFLLSELRILIYALLIFGIPAIVIFLGSLVVSPLFEQITVWLGALLGVCLLMLGCYMNAIIHVFISSAWTLLFLHYTDKNSK